jgi:DNA polymerase
MVAVAALPKFKDLEAYWKFLEEEYPKWFPSTPSASSHKITRAEGMKGAILAIVEMAPAPAPLPKILDGEAGLLFDKMMKAIHLDRSQLYLTSVMKTPAPHRSWPRKDIVRMLPCLFQELELAGCSMVLLLGEACAQAVLRTGRGLDTLRQQATEAEGFVFAASYHPSDLETQQELKRNAWEDLKWLRTRLDLRRA